MKIISIYFFLFTFWITNTIGFSLTGVKGLSLTNLSFYLLLLVWASNIVYKRKLLEWNSLNTYLMLLIFVVILSIPYKILLDEIPDMSLKQDLISIKKYVEPFVIFFIMFNILDDKKTCKKVLFGLGVLLLITALGGPLTSFNIIELGRVADSGRASGFGNTIEFAAYLVLFVPVVLTFALFHKSNTLRTYSVIVLFTTFFALIFSGSRGGIVSFAVSMFGYLFVLYSQKVIRPRTIFYATVIVIMVSTISFVFAPYRVKKRVLHRLDPTKSESVEEFSSGRVRIWRQSISIFTEKPIFGHGYDTIKELMYLRFREGWVAHNQYLNYLVELGIIGCALFILLYLKIFRIMWNFLKITPDLWEKQLYIGYIAGLIGYTFSMLFANLYAPRQIFWFYTAVFLKYGQLKEIGEENNDKSLAIMKKNTVI